MTHNEQLQKRRVDRKEAGLCPDCGRKPMLGRTLCNKCCARNTNGKKAREKTRNLSGRCATCNKPKLSSRRLCDTCHKDFENQKKARQKTLISKGLCSSCGKKPYLPSLKNISKTTKLCQVCYIKLVSCNRFGSIKHWEALLDILKAQNYYCAYTGEKLILGMNDSVDHILPRSRYPDRTFDITNIQWITRVMNTMKLNLLDCEFLAEIDKVVKHLGDDLKHRITTKTYPPPTRESRLYHRLNQ